uniref:Uncharacterized protein n=1 Tax=Cucumis melo TaxID=3656 RepID=A0A9I9DNS7_CUCME
MNLINPTTCFANQNEIGEGKHYRIHNFSLNKYWFRWLQGGVARDGLAWEAAWHTWLKKTENQLGLGARLVEERRCGWVSSDDTRERPMMQLMGFNDGDKRDEKENRAAASDMIRISKAAKRPSRRQERNSSDWVRGMGSTDRILTTDGLETLHEGDGRC